MSQPGNQQVNVADLDLSQLQDVKRQLDEELQHLSSSFAQLSKAQARFKSCVENVNEVNKGKTILVPLSNSLYVPGKLSDPEHVIVDVGTGYYVKKTREEATKHYQSKADFVRTNLQTLQDTIEKKQDNMNYLVNIMQVKLQQQQQAQVGQKS
ncbi:subunit of tubulin prefoldin [Tulasnella sp. JGI-2019a]|nr:subunit of tubulin prefoldin [Tulasnella sp. JGI-2019a]KAG9008740.1 subunit of tubulin prefoldin [Tulasnella sp. JGI-2019a]